MDGDIISASPAESLAGFRSVELNSGAEQFAVAFEFDVVALIGEVFDEDFVGQVGGRGLGFEEDVDEVAADFDADAAGLDVEGFAGLSADLGFGLFGVIEIEAEQGFDVLGVEGGDDFE